MIAVRDLEINRKSSPYLDPPDYQEPIASTLFDDSTYGPPIYLRPCDGTRISVSVYRSLAIADVVLDDYIGDGTRPLGGHLVAVCSEMPSLISRLIRTDASGIRDLSQPMHALLQRAGLRWIMHSACDCGHIGCWGRSWHSTASGRHEVNTIFRGRRRDAMLDLSACPGLTGVLEQLARTGR